MQPLIYTQPTAAIVFLTACLVWLAPEMITTRRRMARVARRSAAPRDRGSMAVLIGLQSAGLVLNFALAWLLPAAAIRWQPEIVLGAGIACMLLGVVLRWTAIRRLGRYFTRDVAVSSDQAIVQSGPYRMIRHPAYSGTFLTMLGLALATSNWAGGLCLMTGVFIGHGYRVSVEERALVEEIGQPYVEYMRRTKRFVPGIF